MPAAYANAYAGSGRVEEQEAQEAANRVKKSAIQREQAQRCVRQNKHILIANNKGPFRATKRAFLHAQFNSIGV